MSKRPYFSKKPFFPTTYKKLKMSHFRSSKYNSITPSPYHSGLFDQPSSSITRLPKIYRSPRASIPDSNQGTMHIKKLKKHQPRNSEIHLLHHHRSNHHTTPFLQIAASPSKKSADLDVLADTNQESFKNIVS